MEAEPACRCSDLKNPTGIEVDFRGGRGAPPENPGEESGHSCTTARLMG